jgi:glycosyltransferase involved in cell wall biosynthesis
MQPARKDAPPAPAAAPQKVLFVEGSAGGVVGGSLTGILELLPYLDRQRYAPALVLAEPKPGLDLPGVPIHVLAPRADAGPVAAGSALLRTLRRGVQVFTVVLPRARELGRLFARERPALVYLASGLNSNLATVVAAARVGVPVVCHFKGFRRIGPVDRFLSRWIDVAITMTDEIARHYEERRVYARRFVTIYDGIEPGRFVTGGGAAVRREFGIPEDAPLVGIVGHIQEWKGQALVAEAVARARRDVPALRCLVVGGIHKFGAAYGEALRARIAAPDLAGHIVLTGARRDVAACMDAMDVVIHASNREPFGRVLLEAMAVGRPVVAPREGGPTEIVADGETGVLVPPRDPDALAAAITGLLRDPTRRLAMGRAARARVVERFEIHEHARAIELVFDEILARRSGATT